MDFSWTDDQIALRDAARAFAEGELNDGVTERDRVGEISLDNWRKCAEFGLQGLAVPPEYGGLDTDPLTTVLTMEGIGYGCRDNGLIFAINAQMWSVQHPIVEFGTGEQRQRYLPGLCDGSLIGAHGMSEPDSGSDAFGLRTRAVRRGEGYVLDGAKTFVTNAPHADLAVVFATTDPKLGRWGITAFIVEKGTPGFEITRGIEKMGLRTAPMGELLLRECYVPEANRLGPEGAGAAIFGSSMEWERASILAANVGAMQRQLDASVQHARQRRQFDRAIGEFQSVSNRIADMRVRLEAARLLLYEVAWLKSQGKSATVEAAIAKLFLSESFVRSSEDAVRIHGGYGYTTEYGLERDLRDAYGGVLYSGTSDIQRLIIANSLGVG
jgi:alkylation response protein AidB-like acyl-CoA dehydrogenase